ncbi:MAG: hypothetical protein KDI63_01485 [Gammaproteobacteria bacterium]|nr:hypothetical protein [Gammaproteobacteria bacterium]
MRITVAAAAKALEALSPLLETYRRRFNLRLVETPGEVPDPVRQRQLAGGADAMLLVGSRRRSPRTVLPGPFLEDSRGRRVPTGWLPEVGEVPLKRFAEAAARLHERSTNPGQRVVAVLSQWNPKYLHLANRIEELLAADPTATAVMGWSGDQLTRDDLMRGLDCGLAAAIYVGHGRPVGWVGYHGTRAHHFQGNAGHPLGVMFSLCCATASRKRTGLSFSEALPLMGRAAASFGAVEATLHADNTRWALGLCQAVRQGGQTLAETLLLALPTSASAIRGYRILGDPLAPLAAAPGALQQAVTIGKYDEYLSA